jgi:hypothetical protein
MQINEKNLKPAKTVEISRYSPDFSSILMPKKPVLIFNCWHHRNIMDGWEISQKKIILGISVQNRNELSSVAKNQIFFFGDFLTVGRRHISFILFCPYPYHVGVGVRLGCTINLEYFLTYPPY